MWLWTSGVVSSGQGRAVVMCVVNETGETFHHGQEGTMDGWDGSGWQRSGTFVASLMVGHLGQVSTSGRIARPLVGMSAHGPGVGMGGYLGIESLAPGRYRLSHVGSPGTESEGGLARGELVVAGSPGDLLEADLAEPAGAVLGIDRVLVPTSGGRVALEHLDGLARLDSDERVMATLGGPRPRAVTEAHVG